MRMKKTFLIGVAALFVTSCQAPLRTAHAEVQDPLTIMFAEEPGRNRSIARCNMELMKFQRMGDIELRDSRIFFNYCMEAEGYEFNSQRRLPLDNNPTCLNLLEKNKRDYPPCWKRAP